MSVPEFMPVLEGGGHPNAAFGACFMEYASVLAGERFSDHPTCVDPVIGYIARNINDTIYRDPKANAALGQLIVPAMGTGGRYISSDSTAQYLADEVLKALRTNALGPVRNLQGIRSLLLQPSVYNPHQILNYASANLMAFDQMLGVKFLGFLIAKWYEKYGTNTEVPVLTETHVERVRKVALPA